MDMWRDSKYNLRQLLQDPDKGLWKHLNTEAGDVLFLQWRNPCQEQSSFSSQSFLTI